MPCRLALDPADLATNVIDELVGRVEEIDPERAIEVRAASDADALSRLHVGTSAPPSAIRLVPEGHGGHVIGDDLERYSPVREASALGSIFTAALGAAEAFKRLADVRPDRKVDHQHLAFCPVSLTSDLARAPDIPHDIVLNLALVGLGAVGTGHALILSELSWSGEIALVDSEKFDTENRGTYSLGTAADTQTQPYKVELGARALHEHGPTTFKMPVADYIERIDNERVRWPAFVLTGLDSIDARHDAQRIWPDHLVDAATGDTALGIHSVSRDGPCLMCFFPKQTGGPSSIERLAELTGLPADSLRVDGPLTLEEIAGLPEEKRELLRPYVGQAKCGLGPAFGLSVLDSQGYRPAIPFVSLQAACLGVGRLLAATTGSEVGANLFQYDALLGPGLATAEEALRTERCYCFERSGLIETVRRARRRGG